MLQFRKHINEWLELSPGLYNCWQKAYGGSNSGDIFPISTLTFRSFEYFSPQDTKVVILGQDPYHVRDKANGLAFGYNTYYKGPIDSSLFNVLREAGYKNEQLMEMNLFNRKSLCSLEHWARQGVLLLNTRLTVSEGEPLSHSYIGWETHVLCLLEKLNKIQPNIVWVCWGVEPRKMINMLETKGLVIISSHPSQYSNLRQSITVPAFTGSNCFDRVNQKLIQLGEKEIIW